MICVEPSDISGTIYAPSSKSESIRSLFLSLFTNKQFEIVNLSNASDVLIAFEIIQCFKNFNVRGKSIVLDEKPNLCSEFKCGESALIARILPVILSSKMKKFIIDGQVILNHRNIYNDYLQLKSIGFDIIGNCFPFRFNFSNLPQVMTLDFSYSSQVLTGLLLTLPFLSQDRVININNLVSKSYINLTIAQLKLLGINIKVNNSRIEIPSNQELHSHSIEVSSDASSLSFLKIIQFFNNNLQLDYKLNYDIEDDFKFLLNRVIIKEDGNISLQKRIDITHNPDIFPVLSIFAAKICEDVEIYGIERLKFKESNRLNSILEILTKINTSYAIKGNNSIIISKTLIRVNEISVDSYNDHRIVFASILVSILFKIRVQIHRYEAVNKSYPSIIDDLKNVGVHINEYNRA